MSNIPNLLNELSDKILLTKTNLIFNDMCNSKYVYTLNSFRNALFQESKAHNIDLSTINDYVFNLMCTDGYIKNESLFDSFFHDNKYTRDINLSY